MKKIVPNQSVLGQLSYWDLRSKDFSKNIARRTSSEGLSCIICGRHVKTPKNLVWEHLGGGTLVTAEEGERLNLAGSDDEDMGLQAVGSDCLKAHPQLKLFLIPNSK